MKTNSYFDFIFPDIKKELEVKPMGSDYTRKILEIPIEDCMLCENTGKRMEMSGEEDYNLELCDCIWGVVPLYNSEIYRKNSLRRGIPARMV